MGKKRKEKEKLIKDVKNSISRNKFGVYKLRNATWNTVKVEKTKAQLKDILELLKELKRYKSQEKYVREWTEKVNKFQKELDYIVSEDLTNSGRDFLYEQQCEYEWI